jgi:hypothetical protein
MTTRDDLPGLADDIDLGIRAWMVANAPAHEPVDLVPGAVWRTRNVRQRPALLVRSAGGLRGAAAVSSALKPALMFLMFVGLIGGAVAVGSRVLRADHDQVDRSSTPPAMSQSASPSQPVVVTGQVVTPRNGQAAIRLADGRVLIVGGSAQAEIWDPSTGRFSATGRMVSERDRPLVNLLLDGRVLVIGGIGLATAEIYDPRTGTFAPTGSMGEVRREIHGGVRFLMTTQARSLSLADGRVLVSGGNKLVEIFDPATGVFTTAPAPPCDPAHGAIARLNDGRVLILCLEGSNFVDTAVLFDPRTNSYASAGTPTTSNIGSATVLADGRVLIAGDGLRANSSHVEIFNPATGKFVYGTTSTNPASSIATLLTDNRVLFVGRAGEVDLYDPRSDSFTIAASQVDGAAAALLADGRVLVLGPSYGVLLNPTTLH